MPLGYLQIMTYGIENKMFVFILSYLFSLIFSGQLGGASAGAMAAAAIVGGVSLADMAREVLAVVCKAGEKECVPTKYIYIKIIPQCISPR
jgi:hypothetical protein